MRYLIFLLCVCSSAFSQIPTRLIINTGFEQPSLGCTNCYFIYPQSSVPGWKTTDATATIEIWGNGFQGSLSHGGSQFAEINSYNAAFLYQEICLAANESVNYSIWYKRRSGTEQMRAQLTDGNNVVITQSTTYTAPTNWTNYTGTLTNNGTAGLRRIGFVAVSAGSIGNLIDDITISLKPLCSLHSFSPTSQFEGTPTQLNLIVNGTLLSSSNVTLKLSGTAKCLTDYTVGTPTRGTATSTDSTITLTLPAGDYNPNLLTGTTAGRISIPLTTIIDGIPELSETIVCTILNISGGGNGNVNLNLVEAINGNGASCGAYTSSIIDTLFNTSPLPITLLGFKAKGLDNKIRLDWVTASEKDNDYFIVLRSKDAVSYEEIGRVDGAGTTNIIQTYQLIDFNPIRGISYYVLTQVDFNGCFEKFPPISIRFDCILPEDIWKKWNFLGQEIR